MSINYGGLPEEFCRSDRARIVILPVPYDGTSTWIKGADRGPQAILEASVNMELYDTETGTQVYRQGIHTDIALGVDADPGTTIGRLEQRVGTWLERGKFVVCLGGEHSISLGSIRAHIKQFPDASVLQLDAHADLRQEYNGSPFNHACVMARAAEVCQITQAGIRSMDVSEKERIVPGRCFFMEDMRSGSDWMGAIISTLNDRVYLTVDLDVLDPSVMPSTGTPEPGGMDWYSLLALIRKVANERELIGFDVVELCPFDHNRAPDFLAAKLIYKVLTYRFSGTE